MIRLMNFLIGFSIVIILFVLLGIAGSSTPHYQAIKDLEGNYIIMTEEVYTTKIKLLSLDSSLELREVIIRVYDEQNRLIRKIEKYNNSKDIVKHEYSYLGSEIIIRNMDTGEKYSHSYFALSKLNIGPDILPFRDTVLFGPLFVWDPEVYPIGNTVKNYSFENNRYEVVTDRDPYPVTIVYYDDLGYPQEKLTYWSKYYMNSNDGLNKRSIYDYDGNQRIVRIFEYKDSAQDHNWHLEKDHRFSYETVTL